MNKIKMLILCIICVSCANKNEQIKQNRIIAGVFDGGMIFIDQLDSTLRKDFYQLRRREAEGRIFRSLVEIEARKKKSNAETILKAALHKNFKIGEGNSTGQNILVYQKNRFLEFRDSLFKVYSVSIVLDSILATHMDVKDYCKYYRGNLNSNIELCIISDIQCYSCQEFEKNMKFIYYKYRDKIKFCSIIVSEGIDKGAIASEAAGIQGRFWEMHDFLFENPQSGFNDSLLIKFAGLLNLDCKKMESDLNNNELKNKLTKQNDMLQFLRLY